MSQSRAFRRAFYQTRNIRHDEAAVLIHAHHAEVRVHSGERIVRHFRAGGGYGADQGGFARVRHAQKPYVRQNLELQFEFEFFPRFAKGKLAGRTVGAGLEMQIAEPARPPLASSTFCSWCCRSATTFSGGGICDDCAYRHAQHDIFSPLAVTIGAAPVLSLFGAMNTGKAVIHQRIDVAVGNGKNTAATSAIAARRTAFWNVFFPAETCGAIASFSGDTCIIASSMYFIR